MTLTTYGFTGSLNAGTWAAGEGYGPCAVKASGDLAVTAVTGARQVTIAAGEAYSAGVRLVSDAAATVNITTPTAGQWFLVVLRRDWSTNSASFLALDGPTTTATTPTAGPTAAPATFASTPGTSQDQPLAWVWANNTATTLVIKDVRNVKADGLAHVGDVSGLYLLRGQYQGQLATVGTLGLYQRAASTWAAYSGASTSTDPAPQTWTPTLLNATVGNGDLDGIYWYTAGGRILNGKFNWIYGSTSTMSSTAALLINLPNGEVAVADWTGIGFGSLKDSSSGNHYNLDLVLDNQFRFASWLSGSGSGGVVKNDGSPLTFAAGDVLSGTFSVYIQ